nr:MAG TPA_asm: hypothetical protein [Caudoviricetes sp.]
MFKRNVYLRVFSLCLFSEITYRSNMLIGLYFGYFCTKKIWET